MKRFEQFLTEQWSIACVPRIDKVGDFRQPVVPAGYDTTSQPDDYLYHVTLRASAEHILQSGSLKSGYKKLAGKNLPANARNRVFLTDKNGVAFWVEKVYWSAVNTGQYNYQNPDVVVLRVPKADLEGYGLTPDDIGSREAHAPAWYVTGGFVV
jgi:hypothetical protein